MDAIDRLHAEFTAMAHNEHIELTMLEDAVCAFVDEMKEQGQPPEAVLVAAKQAAADAGLVPSSEQSLFLTNDHADHVLGEIVRWCIEEYYGNRDVASR
jgi:hypothetical protein